MFRKFSWGRVFSQTPVTPKTQFNLYRGGTLKGIDRVSIYDVC